jgi:hypothetical protein
MTMLRKRFSGAWVGAALLLAAGLAEATPLTVSFSSGSLAASATFDTSGTDLIMTLTNTSLFDVLVPVDVLTAVFFDINGVGALGPTSALLDAGSAVFFGPDGGGNVGGEWAYAAGLAGAPGGATEGISSAGFGLFGAANFGGANLQGPAAVDGLQYGLTSAGDDTTTGNAAVTGGFALIQNGVVFTLSGLPDGFDPSGAGNIANVSFQYGTSLTEPNCTGAGCFPSVPEPSTVLLLGAGLISVAGLGWAYRRRTARPDNRKGGHRLT